MQLDQIRKLENWLRREGSLFRGQTPMEFQQSQELMERMEDLRKLESQLSSMQLKDVDKELLEKLLGGDPKQDFEGVMRMQSLLEEGGYVLEQGDRFDLTPKGVRRVGQLALRDIYKQLRRDGMGRHATRNRGSQEMVLETSRPYVQGDPLHINMIQTLKNALLSGGGVPVRIGPRDFCGLRVGVQHARGDGVALGHELVDELGRALRRGEKSRAGDGEPGALAPSARLFRHRRFLHPRGRAQGQGFAAGDLEHGRPLHQFAGRSALGNGHARQKT